MWASSCFIGCPSKRTNEIYVRDSPLRSPLTQREGNNLVVDRKKLEEMLAEVYPDVVIMTMVRYVSILSLSQLEINFAFF